MFPMFQVIYAHEWMNDAHEYEMQVQLGKNNTRGVTKDHLGVARSQYAHICQWGGHSRSFSQHRMVTFE